MRRCLAIAALSAGFAAIESSPADADGFQKTLISVQRNRHEEYFAASAQQVTPDCPHKWSVTMKRLKGGKQDGVDLLTIDNGEITIRVIPTRGMGILSVTRGDVRLGWDSPVKDVVHPKYVNLQARGGLGWLDGFNEWMCRCGMESNGHPGLDEFINNVGDKAEMELTLHGKVANLPAQELEVVVQQEKPHRITVRARVDEKMLFGPKLELHTELSTIPGSGSFRIVDTIKNVGAQDQEFQMLYHANFGSPLLEKGASLKAPIKKVAPFNARAAEGIDVFPTYDGPTTGYVEQVYLMNLYGDDSDRTTIMLQNRIGDRAASISWSLAELPYLTVWKNTGAIADGYVTGLEPGTNYPNNRRVERQHGRVPKLAPGASHSMKLDFEIHVGSDAVERLAGQIDRIQAGRPTEVQRTAPEAE